MQAVAEEAGMVETILMNISPKAMCFDFVQDKLVWHGAWFTLRLCH